MRKLYFLTLVTIILTQKLCIAYEYEAGLMIYPPRLILENGQKNSQLLIKNNGNTKGGYNTEIVEVEMPQEGTIYVLEDHKYSDFSLKDYLRISPKSFSINAGSSQTIRVSIKPPQDLKEGEYRSHIKVTLSNKNLENLKTYDIDKSDNSLLIDHKISMTIPIMYRHGKTSYSLDIKDAKLIIDTNKTNNIIKNFLDLEIVKTGNQSIRGTVKIYYIENNNKHQLAFLEDVVIYRSVQRRKIIQEIYIPENIRIKKNCVLNVVYESLDLDKPIKISKDFIIK